jgi:hypothetical protein
MCPRCVHTNRPAARYCAVCGLRLPPRRPDGRQVESNGDGWLVALMLAALFFVYLFASFPQTGRACRFDRLQAGHTCRMQIDHVQVFGEYHRCTHRRVRIR